MFFLCRATNGSAGVAGTAQFSRVSVEVEGSLQNPQKVKRTVQVPSCIFTVAINNRVAGSPGWVSWLSPQGPLTYLFWCQVQKRCGQPSRHPLSLSEAADHRIPTVSSLRHDDQSVSRRWLRHGAAGPVHTVSTHHLSDWYRNSAALKSRPR